jgi:hypothetical protein
VWEVAPKGQKKTKGPALPFSTNESAGSGLVTLSREVTSGAKSRQFRSEWTPLGVHVCLDE